MNAWLEQVSQIVATTGDMPLEEARQIVANAKDDLEPLFTAGHPPEEGAYYLADYDELADAGMSFASFTPSQ